MTRARECLGEALTAGTPAFMSLMADTDEGHPFRIGYQVESRSSLIARPTGMATRWGRTGSTRSGALA